MFVLLFYFGFVCIMLSVYGGVLIGFKVMLLNFVVKNSDLRLVEL